MGATSKLPRLSLQVVSSMRGMQRVEQMLGSIKGIWEMGEETYKRIRTALCDALSNAIQQSKGDETKTLNVEMTHTGDHYEFVIEDENAPEKKSKSYEAMKKLVSRLRFDRQGKRI
jgi:anti-sigma regulatory factor (Ser/Thr protein kinase)